MFDNLSEEKKELAWKLLIERAEKARAASIRLKRLREEMLVAIENDKKKASKNVIK